MVVLNAAVLDDAARLAAVERGRRTLPRLRIPLDGIARLAARLLDAPMGVITFIGAEEEHFAGSFGLPPSLAAGGQASTAYSVCKYMVSIDAPVSSPDMLADDDPQLREHPLAGEYGVKAFLGVPLRDADDRPLGSLTVLDTRAREWTDAQLSTLIEVVELLGPIPDRPDTAENIVEDAAAEQRSFLSAILDSMGEGVLALDADGEAVVFNRALREFYELPATGSPGEAIDAAMAHLHQRDGTVMKPDELAVARAMRGQIVTDTEAVLCVPGLPDRYLLTNARPIRDADGRRIGAVSTVRDVTGRRRTERFRDCELAVASILNQADTLTEAGSAVLQATADALGWRYADLRLVDQTACTLDRIARWHTDGHDVSDLLPEQLRPDQASVATLVWATGQPIWVPDLTRLPVVHDDDARRRIDAYTERGLRALLCAPVCDGGTVLGVISCFTDAAEDDEFLLTGFLTGVAGQLGHFLSRARADDLAQDLGQARADFTSLIGHDMRTPLTTIASYTDLLLDDPRERSDDDRHLLQAIARNSTRLRGLIDNLIDLAALQSGHLSLQMCDVDLTAVFAAACEAAKPAADAAGITLQPKLDDDVHVTGDPDRLRQLADLMLAGAIAINPGGGEVPLALTCTGGAAQITLCGEAAGDHRCVPGDTSFSAERATARAIVEQHGGTLTVTGTPDTADTGLIIRLPLPAD
ncbi:PAS domain S-box-containing protein [Cryptosporangium aurantiacum]|uniref:histidine kinase n=2 Tax=Cryptosporangium aurantiacum TaxID=134849 RepID=A0A1M7L2R8_9ACTN|nr:PAS domain S-box-containing protein [Cryptosporangium aurantiacum]